MLITFYHFTGSASPGNLPLLGYHFSIPGCWVLMWAGRWGQDALIYIVLLHDLQQHSNCCGDKRKQSAAHPHTAGNHLTKEDYLYWYKKQSILLLESKIHPVNIYSKELGQIGLVIAAIIIVCIIFFFLLRQDKDCNLYPRHTVDWFNQRLV